MADRREVVLSGRLSPAEMFPAGDNRFRTFYIQLPSGERVRIVECSPSTLASTLNSVPHDRVNEFPIDAPGDFAGDPIICVHGWACSVYSYRYVMPLLAKAGHRVLALDLRGHGLSDKPEGDALYTIDALVDFVTAVFDTLGIQRTTFVGHSMGSGTLAAFATRYPDRIASLILAAPVGFEKTFDIRAASAATPAALTPLLPKLFTRSAIGFVMRRAFYDPKQVSDRDIDEYWAPSQFPAFSKIVRAALHHFDWLAGAAGRFNGLSVPLTIVYGTDDSLVPPRAALRYGEIAPEARMVRVERCGHAIPDEAPVQVAEAVLASL